MHLSLACSNGYLDLPWRHSFNTGLFFIPHTPQILDRSILCFSQHFLPLLPKNNQLWLSCHQTIPSTMQPSSGSLVHVPLPLEEKMAQCHSLFFLFYFILFYLYFLFLAVLGLRFCVRAFSSCGKRGPLFIAVRGSLTVAASLVAEHRLQTRRLSNCGSQA